MFETDVCVLAIVGHRSIPVFELSISAVLQSWYDKQSSRETNSYTAQKRNLQPHHWNLFSKKHKVGYGAITACLCQYYSQVCFSLARITLQNAQATLELESKHPGN